MNRILPLLCALLMVGCDRPARLTEDFNFDWRFTLGDDPSYADPDFDDTSWRALHLPHDWAIEGDFSAAHPSTAGSGALPGGVGWYRKRFTAPPDSRVALEFDGIYRYGTVWVNGREAAHRPYGYSSFSCDITPYLKPGENVVAVRCDCSRQPDSRWYTGCGIYRNVRLVATGPVRVAWSGVAITTPEVGPEAAAVRVVATVEGPDSTPFELRHRIEDPGGRTVARADGGFRIDTAGRTDALLTLSVGRPLLWSPETPACYTLLTEVLVDGRPVDACATPFGIRTIRFTADEGFCLNGVRTKIRGVCLHHDLGALGAAVHPRAIRRQLEILKDMGCNAIRTAHNPPAPELLDLCDRMGFLVMDEAFDMWRRGKSPYDYARDFDAWHRRDLEDLVRRDRNHPSVIAWSIGNEILEQWNRPNETNAADAAEANLLLNFLKDLEDDTAAADNPNVLLTRHLAEIVRRMDPTRPVATCCNHPDPSNNLLRSGAIDLIGFNYANGLYDSVSFWFPGKPFLGTETASSIQSRGFYLHPSTREIVEPASWRDRYETTHHQCSAYDHSRVPWGTSHERAWIDVRDRDFAAGEFVWTGFDYLGEPTPYRWPSRSSYFGIVDLAGFPKDVYYMYRSEWSDRPTLHLFPHWNWRQGDTIDLWVYYNRADEVELRVNGRSLGRRSKTRDRLHARWTGVPFEPGSITAIAYRDGEEVGMCTRRTAGPVADLRLTPDRDRLAADGYDLAFVTIEAVDASGTPVPTASDLFTAEVEGAGELFGLDNGNPADTTSLRGTSKRLFSGKALAVVRTLRGERGPATLTVRCGDIRQRVRLTAE